MKKIIMCILILNLALFPVIAEEDADISIGGFEVEKMLNLTSGIFALVLCLLTLLAYRRNRNRRLLYVSAAFFLFALKLILLSSELFFGEWSWVDPSASVLDFVILLSFFVGILRK